MMLHRLYELAIEQRLLDDVSFEILPIPFVVTINSAGELVDFDDRREAEIVEPKTKGGKPKEKLNRGQELSCPKAHGNIANRGFARYFADTLARILPMDEDPKSRASRETFWKQVEASAADSKDPALQAVERFGQRLADPVFRDQLIASINAVKPTPKVTERCTFAYLPDQGKTILERESVRTWFREFFGETQAKLAGQSKTGICQITGKASPIPSSHPAFSLRGGLPQGVRIVSNDKPAFQSYCLEGAENSSIGTEGAEGYTRALSWLLKRPGSNVSIGDTTFIFWSKQVSDSDDVGFFFDQPTEDSVKSLLLAAHSGKQLSVREGVERNFFCLALSANAARAVVRNYIELTLPQARANLAKWFADLSIIDPWQETEVSAFSVYMLTQGTVRKGDNVPPEVAQALVMCALQNLPIPDHILTASLRRLAVEGSDGFRPFRMALIRLSLLRKGIPMSEQLDEGLNHEAYLCGRLLAVLANLQYAALGDVNANIVDRYYGAASRTPSLVFGTLLSKAPTYLQKLSDKPGLQSHLEQELAQLSAKLSRGTFPTMLSPEDQGRFALGFYHEKADQILSRKDATRKKQELAQAAD
jgi:CRISPR-associated protein Csd1